MKLTFIGATHEVTGSCTLIEVGNVKGLVDYGMQQGIDTFENVPLPVDASDIDFVLLTHAHIDHSGNLPLLYKNGFRGKVYATDATCTLCDIMLKDSAHIQLAETQYKNRKSKRAGKATIEPMYTLDDVQGLVSLMVPCKYEKIIHINEFFEIRFTDIGHLLGSSCIEVWINYNGVERKIVFSGDVGNKNQPIICDPKFVKDTDYLVVESTYGNRFHEKQPDYISILAKHIQNTLDRGGNLIIPSFAVGRAQEMLYFIREIKHSNLVKGHDGFPVYLDSPLADEATSVFLQCDMEYLDEKTKELMKRGINPINFEGLHTAISEDDSKALNDDPTPKVIISASGMCEAGRIRHHLKYNLWRQECTILFVGYQANGTLGRIIFDGADEVKLFGDKIAVNAQISFLPGISGHADKNGLIEWINGFEKAPRKVFVNHGSDDSCKEFTECLKSEYKLDAYAPYSGTVFDMAFNEFVKITKGVPITKLSEKKFKKTSAFARLMACCEKLVYTARNCEGMSNKDLAKFSSQIDNLIEKWKRS